MDRLASYVRDLDPRLKLAVSLALGPSLWLLDPLLVTLFAMVMFILVTALAVSQPLGRKMVRTLLLFVVFWVAVKAGLDAISGMPVLVILLASLELALRLAGLLLLGLCLALSTSARSLGLAVSWILRPFIGAERAWQVALSLALMIHFLPLCLASMNQVNATYAQRCPDGGFRRKMVVVPLAVIRSLGQKTWNQTLAVAGRGLECGEAWEPDFRWSRHDTFWGGLAVGVAAMIVLF